MDFKDDKEKRSDPLLSQASYFDMDLLGVPELNLQNEDYIYRDMPFENTPFGTTNQEISSQNTSNNFQLTQSGPANQDIPSENTPFGTTNQEISQNTSNNFPLTLSGPAYQEISQTASNNLQWILSGPVNQEISQNTSNNFQLTQAGAANQQMVTYDYVNIEITVAPAGSSKSDCKIDEGDTIYIKRGKPLSMCVSNLFIGDKLKFSLGYNKYKNEALKDCKNSDHEKCGLCGKSHPLKFCLSRDGEAFLTRTEGNVEIIDMNEDLLENGMFPVWVAFPCWNSCLKKGNLAKDLDFNIEILRGETIVHKKIYKINCYENLSREFRATKRKSDDVETDEIKKKPCITLDMTTSDRSVAELLKIVARHFDATVKEK